jgi:phosphoribosyl 1,2-cyclic phosphodiesterase
MSSRSAMRVRFWGVRGSLPVPGPKTERYGGNTSCVEVTSASGTRIIVDAGTGIRHLGKRLMHEEFERGEGAAHLLISHTHWDHIQGLPFFSPLARKGNRLHVYGRRRDDGHLRAVFASQTGDPYFPVSLGDARAAISFRELADSACFEIGEVSVTCARLNHPYVATAYRLAADGASVVYVSDTAPFSDILFESRYVPQAPPLGSVPSERDRARLQSMRDGLVRLCEGADLVIYDTMFTPEDYRRLPHYGHSRPSDALEICGAAGAATLALYHHAPERSDAEIDAIVDDTRRVAASAGHSISVVAAYEGLNLELGSSVSGGVP